MIEDVLLGMELVCNACCNLFVFEVPGVGSKGDCCFVHDERVDQELGQQ